MLCVSFARSRAILTETRGGSGAFFFSPELFALPGGGREGSHRETRHADQGHDRTRNSPCSRAHLVIPVYHATEGERDNKVSRPGGNSKVDIGIHFIPPQPGCQEKPANRPRGFDAVVMPLSRTPETADMKIPVKISLRKGILQADRIRCGNRIRKADEKYDGR